MRRYLFPLSAAMLATVVCAQQVPPSTVEPGAETNSETAAATETAQEAPTGSGTAAEDIAAKAMEAMDKLDRILDEPPGSPADEAPAPGKSGTSSKPKPKSKTGTATGGGKAGKVEKSDDSEEDPDSENDQGSGSDGANESTPPLLPGPSAAGGRGMDVLSRARLDMMVPTGRSHRGVHYPMYRPISTDRTVLDPVQGGIAGVTAPMDSLFESELVTRLDNDHVQFDRAKFVQFDEKTGAGGRLQPTMTLELDRGVYDLKNEILMTNQPVKIETPQFLIEGDTMVHDRASSLTRLTGRVKMTFYSEEADPAGAAATPSSTSDPARIPAAAAPAPADIPSSTSKP